MRIFFSGRCFAFVVVLAFAMRAIPAQAQTFEVLHTFVGSDGSGPEGTLVRDEAGNLFGTTYFGGSYTNGVVFKIDRSNTESVLYNFSGGNDGGFPAFGLIQDAAGNLYGLGEAGQNGGGVLFKLTASGNETVLYNFGGCFDCLRGNDPAGVLLRDASGDLYGTTLGGGANQSCATNGGCGTIFRLDATGKLRVLYRFKGEKDGKWPFGPLRQDAAGNLYGTALHGGNQACLGGGCGTIFKLAPNGKLTVLYSFTGGADGWGPQPALAADGAGNFYGAAEVGGSSNCSDGCGTVFKLSKDGKFSVLYSFTGAADGNYPNGGVVLDTKGNLYGTTRTGTTNSFYGTVYKLNKSGELTVLHQLNGDSDGADPTGGLIRDSDGNLYGVAFNGFGHGDRNGTVFEVRPEKPNPESSQNLLPDSR